MAKEKPAAIAAPVEGPPRKITVTGPFEFPLSAVSIVEFRQRDMGEHMVKAAVADYAVEKGFATEGWADGSTTKSRKSGPKKRTATRARKPKGETSGKGATAEQIAANVGADVDATAANLQPVDRLDGARVADDDSARNRSGGKASGS